MPCLWEQDEWPNFKWDEARLSKLLATVSHEQGRLQGKMEALGFDLRNEAHLRTLTEDVIKSSEIEGEQLDPDQVRPSIARRLGMDIAGLVLADREVEGVVEMMLDATEKFGAPLTEERLHGWHAALLPTGRSGMVRIIAGAWRDDRDGPMQVVSGPMGREKVHYEAPPAEHVADEMARFLAWFADPGDAHPLLVAALAHLWFVTIHPFDDGNGRIARAIADMALARSEKTRQRFYSMSSQIRAERKDYYHVLEWTQKGDMDVTRWQEWFLGCLHRAIEASAETLDAVMVKARFWNRFAKEPLNNRQIKVMNKLLDRRAVASMSRHPSPSTRLVVDLHDNCADLIECLHRPLTRVSWQSAILPRALAASCASASPVRTAKTSVSAVNNFKVEPILTRVRTKLISLETKPDSSFTAPVFFAVIRPLRTWRDSAADRYRCPLIRRRDTPKVAVAPYTRSVR